LYELSSHFQNAEVKSIQDIWLIPMDTLFIPPQVGSERASTRRSHAPLTSRTIIPASGHCRETRRHERERGFAGARARIVQNRFSGRLQRDSTLRTWKHPGHQHNRPRL